MTNCSYCKKPTKAGEPVNKVVVSIRNKNYEQPTNTNRRRTELSFTEIVKEVVACLTCANTSKDIQRVGSTLVGRGII